MERTIVEVQQLIEFREWNRQEESSGNVQAYALKSVPSSYLS